MSTKLVQYGLLGLGLVGRLPSFLKRTITPIQAHETVGRRLQQREKDFLFLIKQAVYGWPRSPYLKLLKAIGCEYADLESLVFKNGVEAALQYLYRKGVYLTSDEFRGRSPVIRGNLHFFATANTLQNPLSRRHVPIRSSGSRSGGTPVVMDLEFLRECAVDTVVYLNARKSLMSPKAMWEVPGGFALFRLLTLSLSNLPPAQWFSQLDLDDKSLDVRYRGSARLLGWGGILARIPMPRPQFVSLEDPLPIVRWMETCLLQKQKPHLFTFASSAVRLSRSAYEAGVDLKGIQITMSGEPTTKARLETVRKCNADVLPAMGSAECGYIGYGCLAPEQPDDMHLLTDLHAVIQPGDEVTGPELRSESLLISSLRPSAPVVMLNVSLGDIALLKNRKCGCPLGDQGFGMHLHSIRSFEKLTSGGVALPDQEVIRVLEEVLPKHFGGAPTDYQLLEDENEEGNPILRLVINPEVGLVNEDTVKEVFLASISTGSHGDRVTSTVWSQASCMSIERALPRTTATGKIHHMHIERSR